MQSKKILVAIIGIILLGTLGYFYSLFTQKLTDTKKTTSTKPFLYEDFLKENSVFAQENTLSSEKKYREMAQQFEQALPSVQDPQQKAYAKYLIVRAYVNAVRLDNHDMESLNKALGVAAKEIQNERYPNLRVLIIDLVDSLMYSGVSQEVKTAVMQHPFFHQFDTNNNAVSEFRVALLNYGNNIYRHSNIKMKLALLSTQELQKMSKTSSGDDVDFQKKKSDTLTLMQDADASLNKDLSGEAPFKNQGYTVEPLYIKAAVADSYYRATQELPYGDIENLYQKALNASVTFFPELKPAIEKTYNNFLEYKKK